MKFSIIAAIGIQNKTIGYQNKLPWHIPTDLQRFKKLTLNKIIVMGKNTFLSLGEKPLKKRTNIVISKTLAQRKHKQQNNLIFFSSVNETLDFLHQLNLDKEEEIFIIGGAKIYKSFLPLCDYMYISWVLGETQGDTFFPEFKYNEWKLVKYKICPKTEKDSHDHIFCIYKKKLLMQNSIRSLKRLSQKMPEDT